MSAAVRVPSILTCQQEVFLFSSRRNLTAPLCRAHWHHFWVLPYIYPSLAQSLYPSLSDVYASDLYPLLPDLYRRGREGG